jgi:hypothetical protein
MGPKCFGSLSGVICSSFGPEGTSQIAELQLVIFLLPCIQALFPDFERRMGLWLQRALLSVFQ